VYAIASQPFGRLRLTGREVLGRGRLSAVAALCFVMGLATDVLHCETHCASRACAVPP
jgi:hypothetical protein